MRKLEVTQGKIVHCLVILNITFDLYNFWWFLIIQRWAGSKLIIWIICIYIHIYVIVVLSLSTVQFIVTPWTAARQAPLSMGSPRQEYWSGEPFPSPGDLPDPGIEPVCPALVGRFITAGPPGKPLLVGKTTKIITRTTSLYASSTHICSICC